MSKKKYLIILSTLLFLLLLGYSGTSYAWTYNEVQSTIENVITNSGYNNVSLTNLNTWIHNEVSEEWSPIFSQYDGFMIMNNSNTIQDNISVINQSIRIYAWNVNSDDYNIYEYKNGSTWLLKLSSNYDRYQYSGTFENNWSNGNYYNLTSSNTNVTTNLGFSNRNNPPLWVIFTNKTILANENGGAATQNWNTFNQYHPIFWEFIPNGTSVTLQNDNQWQYRLITGGWGIDLGTIRDSEWADKISYRVAYWNKGLNKFGGYGNFITLYDYDSNGPLYNYWTGTTTNDNGVYSTRITLDTYKFQNCLLQILIEPTIHGQLTNIYQDFYISNDYTVVQNGVVITNSIFSGDYISDYDNQQQENQNNDNTNKIVDSINSTDGADDLIDSYLSGDVDSWGADLGYHPFENPFTSFLFNLVSNVYDALTRRGNVVLDFNHHNTNGWVINTDDFVTPEGPLKNLVRWSMIFFYLYGNYKFFHYLLTLIETAKIDKAIATLGTDEFYDSDIM